MRQIENCSVDHRDKPQTSIVISDCGELADGESDGYEAAYAGDLYPDWPEDYEGHELTPEQLLEIVAKCKQLGTEAYKAGDYVKAIRKYEKGIRYVNEGEQDAEDSVRKQLRELKISLYLNVSLCWVKEEHWNYVCMETSKLLEMSDITEKDRIKALYRRGLAKMRDEEQYRNVEDAYKDLEEAYKLDGGKDGAIVKEYVAAKKIILQRQENQRRLYSRLFQ